MAKNYTWEKFKFKVKEGYYKTCDGAKKVVTVVKENPEIRNALIGLGTTLGYGIVRSQVKSYKHKKEREEQDSRTWDPRIGMYYYHKPLKPEQKFEYTRRYKAGENGAEILRDMGVRFW